MKNAVQIVQWMLDSLQELLLFCADFIFHNEGGKKAPDGILHIVTCT